MQLGEEEAEGEQREVLGTSHPLGIGHKGLAKRYVEEAQTGYQAKALR